MVGIIGMHASLHVTALLRRMLARVVAMAVIRISRLGDMLLLLLLLLLR